MKPQRGSTIMKSELIIEYAGRQVAAKDIVKAVEKDYKANNDTAAKKLDIYAQPETGKVYYVANDNDELKGEIDF